MNKPTPSNNATTVHFNEEKDKGKKRRDNIPPFNSI